MAIGYSNKKLNEEIGEVKEFKLC